MNRTTGCLFLFILSVVAGIIAGYFLITMMESPTPPASTSEAPLSQTSTHTNPARSVLIVGVDNLEKPNPLMEGAWLVTLVDYGQGTIHLRLITLYPIVEASATSTYHIPYTQPHTPIMVDPANLQNLKNLEPISFSPDAWAQVIVLDEVAINTVIMMQNLNFKEPVPTPGSNTFTKPWKDPQVTFDQQKNILQIMCDNPTPMSEPKNIEIITAMEGSHIRSTLPPGGLYSLWQLINYTPSKQVVCTRIP
ncbi:MAG: hypothetical protein ACK2T7_09500 [Anaerolineales bacterium]